MTREEKLTRILAKLDELLAIAEKRTPGKWENAGENIYTAGYPSQHIADARSANFIQRNTSNAAFIAACAGRAEAGWRATRGRIEFLRLLQKQGILDKHDPIICAETDAIIATFPEELL